MSFPIDSQCIFCKIVGGEIPCTKVYEDDAVIAFLDINPIAKGHTLIVPKGHYPTLLEVPESFGPSLISASQRIGNALLAAVGATGFNCVQNNFASAGQVVFHAHWHVIPRVENDGLNDWVGSPYADATTMQHVAAAIRSHIN